MDGPIKRNYDLGFEKTEWWAYAIREDNPAVEDGKPRYRMSSAVFSTRDEAVEVCRHLPSCREPVVFKCQRVLTIGELCEGDRKLQAEVCGIDQKIGR